MSTTTVSAPMAVGPLISQRVAAPVTLWQSRELDLMQRLRVASPGTILSFDATRGTAVVRVAVSEQIRIGKLVASQNGGQYSTTTIAQTIIPDIPDVIVLVPGGGNWVMTTPIQNGDECLLWFGDTCIDWWWAGNGAVPTDPDNPQATDYIAPQVELRRHDLSDAFCLVGPRNLKRWQAGFASVAYSTTEMQLRSLDGTVVIGLAENTININAENVNVNATTATIATMGNTVINASGELNVTSTGDTNVNAADIHLTASNGMQLSAGGILELTGSPVIISGGDYLAHVHSGVTTGGSETGPVFP
jgi:hypothetical protein